MRIRYKPMTEEPLAVAEEFVRWTGEHQAGARTAAELAVAAPWAAAAAAAEGPKLAGFAVETGFGFGKADDLPGLAEHGIVSVLLGWVQ